MSATHKIVNGQEVPLTDEEKAAIEAEWQANAPLTDAAQAQADVQVEKDAAGECFELKSKPMARAVRALAMVTLAEINLLREQHGLPPRTAAQLKQAILNRIQGE